jgi:D-glycero-alpha-D-manno-heptose-7-phosphate kinase
MNKVVLSRAPVRICDIGGWTDTWFYPFGAVFNMCVDLYTYVIIKHNVINRIRIHSDNLDLETEINDYSNINYDDTLDLLKAIVKMMNIQEGLDIHVRAEAPPGCGTGTSASVAVALIAGLSSYLGLDLKLNEIAKLAHFVEMEELNLQSGVQDQYAAAYGGINFMEVNYPEVFLTQVKIDPKRILELDNQLILVYLGSRSSDKMHKAVIERCERKEEATLHYLDEIKKCAYEMRDSINSRIKDLARIINNNWKYQKLLHPLMTNPNIQKLEELAKKNGALAFKCNGAGGGGSAVILSDITNNYSLKKKIIKNGYRILPCNLCFNNVQSFLI